MHVDLPGRRERAEIVEERAGGGRQLGGDRVQVGADPGHGILLRGQRRVDTLGGPPEERPHHGGYQLLLARRHGVQRGLRALEAVGEIIDAETQEAFGEEKRDQAVQDLGVPGGGSRGTRR